MTDPKKTPVPPLRRDGEEEERPRRPRSYTGYVLVALILVIVWLVVQNSLGEPEKLSFPQLLERMLEGRVESARIDNNKVVVTLTSPDARGGREARVTVPERFMTEQAGDLVELTAMGREAAQVDDRQLEALYVRLGRSLERRQDDASAPPLDFGVYRRYVIGDRLLVRMTRPSGTDEAGAVGGAADAAHTGRAISVLLEPRNVSVYDPAAPAGSPPVQTYAMTFARLLEATNTVEANAALGLKAPADVTTTITVPEKSAVTWAEGQSTFMTLLISLLPWLLIIGFLWFFVFRQMRGAGMGGNVLNFGRSRARLANKERSTVTFEDVAGIEEAKDEVGEIVEFLKNPQRFARLGGRTPRGVLLAGPPGTGKTLLAKAIAGEAEVPFFSISGSDFVEMFVGVGASRVRDLFKQARESSPCIVFLDEIDAVGRRRGAGLGGGHDEREQTLNAILVEMDGFDTDTGIIVIAATNRIDVLDPALLRPGRFDRQITVELPDVKGREAILRVHARKARIHPSVDYGRIARGTPGFSGAELEALVNEAAILATMANKDAIDEHDLEEARDRIRWGRAKSSRIMDEDDQKVTAYHEAGHALVAYLLPKADPLHKVTIIPRGPALGVTMYLPEKDRYSMTKGEMEAYLRICFGGRVAEELFCGDITSGAANDIKQATRLARRMVVEWGMADAVGPISYEEGEENPFLGRDIGRQTRLSDATIERIDAEVHRIIEEAYADCRRLLAERREDLELIAANLLRYEVLSKEEIDGLLHGESVEAVRGRRDAARRALEKDRRETPVRTPVAEPKRGPEPDFPGGLAGEGAR